MPPWKLIVICIYSTGQFPPTFIAKFAKFRCAGHTINNFRETMGMGMNFSRIENWYRNRCDGEWEHDGGIRIATLDNPGWIIHVNFCGLDHRFDTSISSRNFERSEDDWAFFSYDAAEDELRIACGPANLTEVFEVFFSIDPEEVRRVRMN